MDPASTAIGVAVKFILDFVRDFLKSRKQKQIEAKNSRDLLQEILTKKIVKIGWFNYKPFVYTDKSSPQIPIGIYPILMSKLASKFGLKIEWKQLSLSEAVENVKKEKVDMVISIFETPSRAKEVDFTAYLHAVHVAGVVKKTTNTIHSQSDLLNIKGAIAVAENEIGHEFVNTLKIPSLRLQILKVKDIFTIISLVISGDAEVAILDLVSIKNYFDSAPENIRKSIKRVFTKPTLKVCQNGIMILQNQVNFGTWLDDEIRLIRNTEEIEKIEKGYLVGYEDIIQRS